MMTKLSGTWLNPSSDYYYSVIILIATCIIDGVIGLIALYLYWRQNMYRLMGNKFLKQNKILPAVEAYERHKKINPEDRETQKRLCALYVQEGIASENAIKSYKEALELDPFQKDICKALAEAYAKQGHLDEEAVTCYGRALQFFPNTPLFIAMMGRAYYKKGDEKSALEFFERAVELGYEDVLMYDDLCVLYLKGQIFNDAAREAADTYLRLAPEAMEPRTLLCKIYLCHDNVTAAEKEARVLLQKNADNIVHLEFYADVMLAKREYKAALQYYNEALKHDADNAALLKKLSKTMILAQRRDEEALEIYKKVKDEEDIPADIHYILYEHFLGMRKYSEARKQLYLFSRFQSDGESMIKTLEDLCAKDEDAEGYAYLGNLHFQNDGAEHAATCYKKALSFETKPVLFLVQSLEPFLHHKPDAELFLGMSRLYDEAGKTREAVLSLHSAFLCFPEIKEVQENLEAAARKYLKENKDDAEIRAVLGTLYEAQKKYDSAIAEFQHCGGTPFEEHALLHMGQCFMEKDLPEIALEHLGKLARRNQFQSVDKAEVFYHYGLACEKAGRISEAVEAYFKTLHENKNFRDTEQKIEKLQKGMTLGSMQTVVVEHPEEIKQRYEIKNEIGKGTFGVVYFARDTLLERDVALKILHDRFLFNRRVKERFFKEARASAVLSHKNIISIYDVGELGGKNFICMEYVDGQPLEKLIKTGKMFSGDDIKNIAFQICDALEHAHQKNIVHGNMHPKNIFLKKDGTVKISDFSLNQTLTEFTNTLSGGSFLENPYLSPEEIIGEENDARSDIYSLGILLAQLLTGELPFKDANEKLKNVLPTLDSEDAVFKPLIKMCVQQDKTKRFQSAAELKNAIMERN